MSHDEELAKLRADMDQAREGMKELSGTCWGFYAGLVEEGFSSEQALRLTLGWLTAMLRGAGGSSE